MGVGRLIFLKNWIEVNIDCKPLAALNATDSAALAAKCGEEACSMGFRVVDLESDIGGPLTHYLSAMVKRRIAKRARKRDVAIAPADDEMVPHGVSKTREAEVLPLSGRSLGKR